MIVGVGDALAHLLDPPVYIADMRFHIPDSLAPERYNQPQHSVRGRVLGAHIDHIFLLLRYWRFYCFFHNLLGKNVYIVFIILSQRVAPAAVKKKPPEVRVIPEPDAKEVICFPLMKLGGRPEFAERINFRIFTV